MIITPRETPDILADYTVPMLSDFDQLTQTGIIGFFDHFEITEICAFKNEAKNPINVFTIAVATEGGGPPQRPTHITPKLINIPGLKNVSFGIFRTVISVADMRQILEQYLQKSVWQHGAFPLPLGSLAPLQKTFVQSDQTLTTPLNHLLKNNFFCGSYILELFDRSKEHVSMLLENPPALQALSNQITDLIPIEIASVSDRLGNIILQFPIEVIRAKFFLNEQNYGVEVAWHPKVAKPRSLTASVSIPRDRTTLSVGQASVTSGKQMICRDTGYGLLNGSLWDTQNNIQLMDVSDLAFFRSANLLSSIGEHEPRVLPTISTNQPSGAHLQLTGQPSVIRVGEIPTEDITDHINKRIYEDELKTLTQQRKFVQYAVNLRNGQTDRDRALNDLRGLIRDYGQYGVWLWDPFLSAQDIFDTLFLNKTSNSLMRALTLLKTTEGKSKEERLQEEQDKLNNSGSNLQGIKLEYRSAHGQNGWDFHDRFIIFPKHGRHPTKAWSLGTSVNSLGSSHHILQQVDHAQLIADAFETLWQAIDQPENLIWQHP